MTSYFSLGKYAVGAEQGASHNYTILPAFLLIFCSRFVVQLAEKNVSLLTCSPLKDIETLFCTAALC